MILTTNDYGYYEEPKEGLIQYWSEENQRMECGIIIVGYFKPLNVEQAEDLADRLEQLVTEGEKLHMHGAESSLQYEDGFVVFEGGFTVGRCYSTRLRLTYSKMQLSLKQAMKMVMDIRDSVDLCLAVFKGMCRMHSLTINQNFIERIIDTEDPKLKALRKKQRLKNDHAWCRLMTIGE